MNTEQPTDQAIQIDAMRAALIACGWREILGRIWKSPRGKLFGGIVSAYEQMKRNEERNT